MGRLGRVPMTFSWLFSFFAHRFLKENVRKFMSQMDNALGLSERFFILGSLRASELARLQWAHCILSFTDLCCFIIGLLVFRVLTNSSDSSFTSFCELGPTTNTRCENSNFTIFVYLIHREKMRISGRSLLSRVCPSAATFLCRFCSNIWLEWGVPGGSNLEYTIE